MRFLLDNCMPGPASGVLSAFDQEHTVTSIRDHFDPSIKDTDWIKQVAQWEVPPIVISGDGRILRNAVERRVLKEGKLSFFLMSPSWCRLRWSTDYAWRLVKIWPYVLTEADLISRPTVFEIGLMGNKITRKPNL